MREKVGYRDGPTLKNKMRPLIPGQMLARGLDVGLDGHNFQQEVGQAAHLKDVGVRRPCGEHEYSEESYLIIIFRGHVDNISFYGVTNCTDVTFILVTTQK